MADTFGAGAFGAGAFGAWTIFGGMSGYNF